MRKVPMATCCVLAAVVGWGQNQVATVTSSTPFTLRGAAVTPGQGVPMWPILAGDTVKAGSALTITTFPDGSVLTLDPESEARIEFANGKPVFQLLKGVARFSLKSISAVQLEAGNKIVTPKDLTGTLTLGGIRPAAVGFWTVGTTVAVLVGAGAAAGAGIGISEAVRGGSSVSPSQ
jgi:hypothetical protein